MFGKILKKKEETKEKNVRKREISSTQKQS